MPKVGPDIHIKVGKVLYSVPWRNIGKQVDAREGVRTVEVYFEGTLTKSHVRIEKGKQTDHADYPPDKIAFMMRTPAWCRRRAAELGESVADLVGVLMEVNALYRLRSAQGVVHLVDKYDAERLNAACRRAIDHAACRRGHSVVFTKTSGLLADLAGGHADRGRETRLRRWARPGVLILDDFAIRDFTLTQADDLYELVTGRGPRPAIFTANRQASDWYTLRPNRLVAESILDRTVNSAGHVHMDGLVSAQQATGLDDGTNDDRPVLRGCRVRQHRRTPPRPGRAPTHLLLAGLPPVTRRLPRPQPDSIEVDREDHDGERPGRCWVVTLGEGPTAPSSAGTSGASAPRCSPATCGRCCNRAPSGTRRPWSRDRFTPGEGIP